MDKQPCLCLAFIFNFTFNLDVKLPSFSLAVALGTRGEHTAWLQDASPSPASNLGDKGGQRGESKALLTVQLGWGSSPGSDELPHVALCPSSP